MEKEKRFAPPIEDPSINTDLLADILAYLQEMNVDSDYDRRTIQRIQKAADNISVVRASNIGMGDMVVRLRRNAAALQLIRSMYIDCVYAMRSEIRQLFDASQTEHEKYMEKLSKIKETYAKQNHAERSAVYRRKRK